MRNSILYVGADLWANGIRPTPAAIAVRLGVSRAAVLYYFRTTRQLHDAIARYGVNNGNSRLIVQLVAIDHTAVAGLSDILRSHHFSMISPTSD